MSKSIKLKDNTYIDSTGVTHNRGLLSTILSNLKAGANRGVKTLTSKGTLGWGTNNDYLPDLGMMAYWNGAYSGTNSNLTYAHQGTIQCKPKVLYNNTTGAGTVTLSETLNNYQDGLVIVVWGVSNTEYTCNPLIYFNSRFFSQMIQWAYEGYHFSANISGSGTSLSITQKENKGWSAPKIFKVIAYK